MPYKGHPAEEVKFVGTGSTSFDGHTDYITTGTDIADDLGNGYSGALSSLGLLVVMTMECS